MTDQNETAPVVANNQSGEVNQTTPGYPTKSSASIVEELRRPREDAWVEMKLRMIQRRCQEAVDVLNDLTPQPHDAAYKMGYASHALGGIIEDIDFTLSMRGQVELFAVTR